MKVETPRQRKRKKKKEERKKEERTGSRDTEMVRGALLKRGGISKLETARFLCNKRQMALIEVLPPCNAIGARIPILARSRVPSTKALCRCSDRRLSIISNVVGGFRKCERYHLPLSLSLSPSLFCPSFRNFHTANRRIHLNIRLKRFNFLIFCFQNCNNFLGFKYI